MQSAMQHHHENHIVSSAKINRDTLDITLPEDLTLIVETDGLLNALYPPIILALQMDFYFEEVKDYWIVGGKVEMLWDME